MQKEYFEMFVEGFLLFFVSFGIGVLFGQMLC